MEKILKELHDGSAGGNFGGEIPTHKILRVGYYLPTLFNDAHAYARKCKVCQMFFGKERIQQFLYN